MKRYAAPLLTLVFLAGCRGQMPTTPNVWAPYGPTRVPPPPTGSYGQPDTYYQPSTQPAPSTAPLNNTGLRTEGSAPMTVAASKEDSATNERANRSDEREASKIRLVSAGQADETEAPLRIVETGEDRSMETPELKGMPVNDATRPREPRRFVPAERMRDISQLPPPPTASGGQPPARTISRGAPTPTPAPPRAQTPTPDAKSTEGWRSRDEEGPPLRVAGR